MHIALSILSFLQIILILKYALSLVLKTMWPSSNIVKDNFNEYLLEKKNIWPRNSKGSVHRLSERCTFIRGSTVDSASVRPHVICVDYVGNLDDNVHIVDNDYASSVVSKVI